MEEPSIFDKAKNLASSSIEHIKGGLKYVSDEKKSDRLNICQTCELFDSERVRCKKCGCNLNIKTGWETSKCPIGKW